MGTYCFKTVHLSVCLCENFILTIFFWSTQAIVIVMGISYSLGQELSVDTIVDHRMAVTLWLHRGGKMFHENILFIILKTKPFVHS